jgi:serine/threonine protein kinase
MMAHPDRSFHHQEQKKLVSLFLLKRKCFMAEQGPLSGQTVGGKYVLGELLGEGGFGVVYKAHHSHLQRQQAIKILLERLFQKQAFRERFLHEAQIVAALDHPNIIHTDDFWVEPSRAYLVMPFIKGGTLQDVLRKQQKFLELEQIVFYLEHICAALDYAHANGVAHLDLKPLNLLVHDTGRLLLTDFGLAHLMKQGVVTGGPSLLFGTPHYMAPEHIQGHPEKRSDLFSLGVTFYQMLVGRLPFEGLTPEAVMLKNLVEWPPAPRMLRQELPPGVEDVVAKALAKQPEQRYQTASDLLSAFKKALLAPAQAPAAVSPQRQTPPDGATQPGPQLPPHTAGFLRIEEGKGAGLTYKIRGMTFSIGRFQMNDIILDDPSVSLMHASVLEQRDHSYVLRDAGSASGTRLNGQLVNEFQDYPLQEGDRIQISQTVLIFSRR